MKVVNKACEFEYEVSTNIAERRNLKVMILFTSSKCLAPDFGVAYLIARAWQKPKWQKEFSGRRWTDISRMILTRLLLPVPSIYLMRHFCTHLHPIKNAEIILPLCLPPPSQFPDEDRKGDFAAATFASPGGLVSHTKTLPFSVQSGDASFAPQVVDPPPYEEIRERRILQPGRTSTLESVNSRAPSQVHKRYLCRTAAFSHLVKLPASVIPRFYMLRIDVKPFL